ncbi:MAG: hypothetical protein MJZ10_02430 [Fibrobacter sp.]|nr:hypothetical protein [Fibrobacter sp.]
MKRLGLIVVVVVAFLYGGHQLRVRLAENAAIEKHNALVEETNACLESGDWKCAEKDLKVLLSETPEDRNLQLHMAGVLLEQERYEDCIAYISGLGYSNGDLEYLTEKSKMLIREMETLGLERSAHFRLEFDGRPSRSDVLEALSVLEVAYDSLCHLFDFRPENKLQVVLYESEDHGGVGGRPAWAGALFDGKLRIPVNVMQYREVYRPMLFHELTHAFIRAVVRVKIPTWANEGIAQVVDASRNDVARPAGSEPSLDVLSAPFVGETRTDEAVKLYWYSQKMVEGMLKRNADFTRFRDFIKSLSSMSADEALQKFYGVTAQQLLNEV